MNHIQNQNSSDDDTGECYLWILITPSENLSDIFELVANKNPLLTSITKHYIILEATMSQLEAS